MNTDVASYSAVLQGEAGDSFVPLVYDDWDRCLPDGIHPNSQGYRQMYQQIKRLLI